MSAKKKCAKISGKELPLSIVPNENGQVSPVFKLIVTDHSSEQVEKIRGKKKSKKISCSAEVSLPLYYSGILYIILVYTCICVRY